MVYSTTITRKGQITIPKKLRDTLGLSPDKKILLEFESEKKELKLKPHPDILDLAGTFVPKRKVDVLKAREALDRFYERV